MCIYIYMYVYGHTPSQAQISSFVNILRRDGLLSHDRIGCFTPSFASPRLLHPFIQLITPKTEKNWKTTEEIEKSEQTENTNKNLGSSTDLGQHLSKTEKNEKTEKAWILRSTSCRISSPHSSVAPALAAEPKGYIGQPCIAKGRTARVALTECQVMETEPDGTIFIHFHVMVYESLSFTACNLHPIRSVELLGLALKIDVKRKSSDNFLSSAMHVVYMPWRFTATTDMPCKSILSTLRI